MAVFTGLGSAASPSITFSADPNTGLFSPGADQLAISTNGVERVEFGTSEVVFNDGNNNYDFRIESDNNANLFFVDASVDRLGIGHASPATLVHIADTLAGSPVTTRIENFSSSANSDAVIELKTPNETYGLKANRSGARLDLDIGGTPKISITTGGLVGIGTTSPSVPFHVLTSTSNTPGLFEHSGSVDSYLYVKNSTGGAYIASRTNDLSFHTSAGATERARIDSSGRLLVGTSSARSTVGLTGAVQVEGTGYDSSALALICNANSAGIASTLVLAKSRGTSLGSNTVVQNGDSVGEIAFVGADGSDLGQYAAQIKAEVDGTPGANDMPGRLVFSTTADGASSPTERMRITNSGQVRIGSEVATNNFSFGVELSKDNNVLALIDSNPSNSGSRVAFTIRTGTYSTSDLTSLYANFIRGDGAQRGQIRCNGATAVAYESASDYRLKENVTPLINATARLQQLKPYRFNFIDDGPERVVDGFFAHEVQEIIPEAAGGVKDAVDAEGNPIYQGMDQSKLVPLLTAALQEAITKIEALETRLSALEAA